MIRGAKKWISMGLMCTCVMNVVGCENENVEYRLEGESETTRTDNAGTKGGMDQFTDTSAWNDAWQTINEKGTQIDLTVENAAVLVPKVKQMSVVEVREQEFDADYKKRIANAIFGKEDVYYYDAANIPKGDLQEIYERYQAGETYISYTRTDYNRVEEALKSQIDFEKAMEEANDTYTPVGEYHANEYLGMRGEVECQLSFLNTDVMDEYFRFMHDGNGCLGRGIYLSPKDINQVCPNEVQAVGGSFYNTYDFEAEVENQCPVSEDDAKELADQFVDELGLDYPVYSGVKPLAWWKGTDFANRDANYMAYGYLFYYDIGVDDISFVAAGTQENYGSFNKKKETDEEHLDLNCRLEVVVTEKGVIGMSAYNPLEITSIQENVGLLSLETVKKLIKDQTTEYAGRFRFYNEGATVSKRTSISVAFNELELMYFRVADRQNPGYYSYVPAWRLSAARQMDENMRATWIENPVLINAIDGSVIDFYDEV